MRVVRRVLSGFYVRTFGCGLMSLFWSALFLGWLTGLLVGARRLLGRSH